MSIVQLIGISTEVKIILQFIKSYYDVLLLLGAVIVD